MLGIIELVFSIVGIYGFFAENLMCIVMGLIGIIICDFIDIFICRHNPTTILLACILATGTSIANKSPLTSFTIALCGENFIMTIITVLMIAISFITSKVKKDNYNISPEVIKQSDEKMFTIDNNKYIELANILIRGLDAKDIDDAISKAYQFYKENGVDVDSVNLKCEDKEKTLCLLTMIGLGTNNIEDTIKQTKEFYEGQGINIE